MDKVPENIEDLLNLLPPSRQQMVRRQLVKIAEENPTQHLMLELTLVKLGELQRDVAANAAKSAQPTHSIESNTTGKSDETLKLKKEFIGEFASLRRDLAQLFKVAEDTQHIRVCTDRTESKLDVLRPYRLKIAVMVLLIALVAGACSGWYGRRAYSRYQYEQYMRNR